MYLEHFTDKPGTPPEHLHVVDANDELMHLLELIQVKSERIKSELDQDPSAGGGGSASKSSKGKIDTLVELQAR